MRMRGKLTFTENLPCVKDPSTTLEAFIVITLFIPQNYITEIHKNEVILQRLSTEYV